jgi:hypothetical protein
MRFKSVGNKRDNVIVVVKNSSTTIAIKAGAPVFLNAENTDGVSVISAENLAAASQVSFLGLAVADIPVSTDPKPFSEAVAYGQCDFARFLTRTRAASTDTWASVASLAAFVLLAPHTGVSSSTGPSVVQALQSSAAALAGFIIMLMQSIGSSASQASTYLGAVLAEVRTVKVLVRAL